MLNNKRPHVLLKQQVMKNKDIESLNSPNIETKKDKWERD